MLRRFAMIYRYIQISITNISQMWTNVMETSAEETLTKQTFLLSNCKLCFYFKSILFIFLNWCLCIQSVMAQMVRTHLFCILDPRFESLQSLYVYKYVDKKGSAATLAMKQLACITPRGESEESIVWRQRNMSVRDSPYLWNRSDITWRPKMEYQWPHKRIDVLQKFTKKMSVHWMQ